MILFYDTETTGFPDYRLPADDTRQPHIVQLAAILCESDGSEKASISLIVKPDISIPEKVAAIHGISNDVADRCGISPKLAAATFNGLCGKAETIVAHNIKFDEFLINTLFIRTVGRPSSTHAKGGECTMEMCTNILNLPPTEKMVAAGFDKPKPPKLEEAYKHFFGRDLVGAHDALVDVRACMEIYFHMKKIEAA